MPLRRDAGSLEDVTLRFALKASPESVARPRMQVNHLVQLLSEQELIAKDALEQSRSHEKGLIGRQEMSSMSNECGISLELPQADADDEHGESEDVQNEDDLEDPEIGEGTDNEELAEEEVAEKDEIVDVDEEADVRGENAGNDIVSQDEYDEYDYDHEWDSEYGREVVSNDGEDEDIASEEEEYEGVAEEMSEEEDGNDEEEDDAYEDHDAGNSGHTYISIRDKADEAVMRDIPATGLVVLSPENPEVDLLERPTDLTPAKRGHVLEDVEGEQGSIKLSFILIDPRLKANGESK